MKEDFYSYFRAIKEIKKLDSKLEKDGWVVNGTLDLCDFGLYFLPIIKKVTKDFFCCYNELSKLDGCPKEVGRHFDCSTNNLITLKNSPQKVGGDFDCSYNQLATFDGLPKKIGGYFCCSNNYFT